MHNREPAIDEITRAVLLAMKDMPITDFGRRACRVLGVYIEPAWNERYATAEVCGIPEPFYFRIRSKKDDNSGGLTVESIDFFSPGPSAPYTTWVNPTILTLAL